jgi:glutaredoxin
MTVEEWEMEYDNDKDEIILFTQYGCKMCPAVRELLEEKGIEYREVNVQTVDGLAEWAEKGRGIKGTPLLIMNDRAILGYEKIEEAIKDM